jgi:hypothetical protein
VGHRFAYGPRPEITGPHITGRDTRRREQAAWPLCKPDYLSRAQGNASATNVLDSWALALASCQSRIPRPHCLLPTTSCKPVTAARGRLPRLHHLRLLARPNGPRLTRLRSSSISPSAKLKQVMAVVLEWCCQGDGIE